MTSYATLYTDGSCNNLSPNGMGMGIVIRPTSQDPQDYFVYLPTLQGEATSNIAEFLALLHGLRICKEQGVNTLHIFCDSQVLVRGITREYTIKDKILKSLLKEIDILLNRITYTIEWIPRKLNQDADRLSKYAISCQSST